MRINQSPNWRALAVLGALLSVIIVWPTVLSMPMLKARTSKSTASTSNNSTNNTKLPSQPPSTPLFVEGLLSNLTSINYTTVTTPNGTIIQTDNYYNNNSEQNNNNNSESSDYSDYGNNLLQLNVNLTDISEINENEEHLTTHDRSDIDPLYKIMKSLDDGNMSNSRRVRESLIIYNKRKRKKTNDDYPNELYEKDDISNTTYLSSASISDDDDDDNFLNLSNYNSSGSSLSVNSSDEVTLTSVISRHHYSQIKRTRKSDISDTTSDRSVNDDDDSDSDRSDVTSTQTNEEWNYQFSTTTPIYDFDLTSDTWNSEQMSNDDANVTFDITPNYVIETSTSTSTSTSTLTSTSTSTSTTTTTLSPLTNTELPVLSRTDRSVHRKRGIPDGQRGLSSRHNGGQTAELEGGSIKSRRLKNHNKNHIYRNNNHTNSNSSNLDRNERSTISHISGPGRKIQLYIKNRFIQLMPDGTVNGTQDDLSDYTILQRTTVDVGRIKIQGVATCLYLCMDQCGAVYGSKEFTDDCVFNESMEQHNYNTYSSTYNSNSRRIYYLALNRHGEPRKLQIPPSRSLGKLATYTKAITETVPQDRVEKLIAKKFGANRVKHGIRQLCDTGKPLVELTDKILKARPQCTATNSNSNSNSNTNSNSNNSNKNGQLNVPAANDKSRLSNSNLTNSGSTISSSMSTATSTSSGSNSSSISNSSSNGHTSSNSNNNHVIKKKKKKRRCRQGETEEEHNCQRGGPQAMKKRPANSKMPKCKDAVPGTPLAVECAKRPKKGGKKQQQHHNGSKHNGGAKQNGSAPAGAEGRRGGKKLNQNGRQQQGGNPNNNNNKNSHKKINGKQPKNGLGGGGRTTIITTVHPITNVKQMRMLNMRSTTTTTTKTTTAAPTTTAASVAPSGPAVNSQQQTPVSSSQVNQSLNQTSAEADESDGEETSAAEETAEAEADDEDAVNEDDDTSSHLPFIGEHTQLVGAADDFLYDDDLDFLPLGLWKIFLILWITKWFL